MTNTIRKRRRQICCTITRSSRRRRRHEDVNNSSSILIISRPWSSILLLTLTLFTNTLLQPATAQKTSLQGYLYWDINSNGILDQGELNSGVVDMTIQLRDCASSATTTNFGKNTNNVIVDETISKWHPLNPGEKFEGHNAIYSGGGYYKFDIDTSCLITDDDLTITTATTEETTITTNGGKAAKKGCYLLVSSLEGYQITSSFPLRHLNYHERDFTTTSSGTIGGGRASQVFDWIPYYDVMPTATDDNSFGSSSTTSEEETLSSSSMINHGYHARTQQCFGYHPTKHAWYMFPSSSSTSTTTITTSTTTTTTAAAIIGGSSGKTTTTSTAIQLATPNEYQYGYDTLIYGPDGNTNEVDVYDTTLSMTPVGLSENGWPLELRVTTDVTTIVGSDDNNDKTMDNDKKGGGGLINHHNNNGGLILGLKLDKDRTTGDYVLLSDSENLEEGKGKSGGGTNGERGGEARFEFVSTSNGGDESVSSALTYFSDRRGDGGGSSSSDDNVTDTITFNNDDDDDSSNEEEYDPHHHDNNRNGILENPRVMIDVIQSFLLERGNLNTLEGGALELAGLTVVLLNQWSLVSVVDKAQKKKNNSQQQQQQQQGGTTVSFATRDLVLLAGEDDNDSREEEEKTVRPPLRGSLSLSSSGKDNRGNSNKGSTRMSSNHHRLLRGGYHQQHPGSNHRSMIALPEPHLVFEFAVYAKYRERRDTPNQDAVALQVSSNFGNIVANTCNTKREALIARIRGRSGYFQGCNPKTTQSSNNENTDGSVTYTAFGGGEKDYVEINIGVVNRFDCDKLLPLYYFELESLAVRPIIDNSGGSLSRQGEVLSKALQLLQVDDGYYDVRGAPTANNSSKPIIVVSVSVVMGVLFVATVAAVWYVRRERRKLREERERRRKAKEARKQRKHERSLKKEAKGKKERVALATTVKEESIPVKVDDAPSLSNGLVGDKQASKNEGIKHESDDDSDADSELERLFDSPEPDSNSREEKDARPTREPRRRKKKAEGGGSESDSDHLNASSRSQRRKRRARRRRKRVDGGSETDSKTTDHDASNISGMNNTTFDDRQSTDKTPATRSQSSHHESDPHSSKADADEDSEPPTRIEVSKRDTLQKGISDISLGLAASLKKSFTRAAATLKDLQDLKEDDPAVTLKDDLQEDDPNSEKEDHPREKKKEAKSSEHKDADTSRKDRKGELRRTRSRRTNLTKAMSSFRKSSTAIKADVGEESRRKRGSRPALSKVMSSIRKSANENEETNTSERKTLTRSKMLSQVRMSVRNLVIGELSSSSDDDSSSGSDSSSDSDSSSSSDNSADMKRKRHARKAVSRRTTSESKSRKEKESDTENSRQRKPSRHGRGEKRASLDDKMKPKESEEMSKTNDYLPHKLDANTTEFTRVDDSSCAAVATMAMKPPSERSLGSKTKSSKSNSDSHRADTGSKRSRRDKSESHGHRERRKKDKSSRHHSSSKKSHKKKDEEGKGNTVRKSEHQGSRKALDNLRSSFKRSLSLSNSMSGKKLSESAKVALESEEDAKDSKKKSKHSSKRNSSRKHRHRDESDRGSHRDQKHREDDRHRDESDRGSHRDQKHREDESERGEKDAERNAERRKRQSRRKYSDEFPDRETDRGASHKGRTHKSSPHRTKTKSSSSKHPSHKKSSGNGERSSRRRTAESAN